MRFIETSFEVGVPYWLLSFLSLTFSGRLQCWIEFGEAWQWQVYMSLVAATLFAAPALIIAACYAVIVATIWRQGRQLQPPQPGTFPKITFFILNLLFRFNGCFKEVFAFIKEVYTDFKEILNFNRL